MNNFDPVTVLPIYENVQISKSQTERPPKKKRKFLMLIIVSILAFTIISAFLYFYMNGGFDTKKEKVFKGITNTFSSLSASPLDSFLDLTVLSNKVISGQYSIHSSLFLNDASINELDTFIGSGFSSDTIINLPESEISSFLSINYENEKLVTADFYAYEDNISIACKDIFEGYLQFQTENFSDKFNFSPLSTILDTKIDEKIDFNIFDLLKNNAETSGENKDLINLLKEENIENTTALMDAITVTSLDPKIITIDGKDKKCKQYNVILPATECSDLLNAFFESLEEKYTTILPADYIKKTFNKDIQFNVAIYKNNIVYFELEEYALGDDFIISSAFTFVGKDAPLDMIIGTINTTENNAESEINISIETERAEETTYRNANFDADNYSIQFESVFNNISGDGAIDIAINDLMTFSLVGEFKDVTEGESFTYVIKDLELSFNDENEVYFLNFSGEYGIDTANYLVATPSGTAYDLFTMSDEDYKSLQSNIIETLPANEKLSSVLIDSGINLMGRSTWQGYENSYTPLYFPNGVYAKLPVRGYLHEDFVLENMLAILDDNYDYYREFYDYYMEYLHWNFTFYGFFPTYDNFINYIKFFAWQKYEYRCTNDLSDVFDITDYLVNLDESFDLDKVKIEDYIESQYGDYPNW